MSNTRQRLIDTAFELFGRNGFHAIGMDAILNEVGCSKQTFYNHFESKDDLVLAVLKHRHEVEGKNWERLFTEIAGPDPRDRLYALFDVLETWFNQPEWRGCIFITAAAEFPLRHEPAHIAAAEHFESFREWIHQMAIFAGAENPKLLADQLILLVEGAVSVQHLTRDTACVEIARAMAIELLDRHLGASAQLVETARA